MILSLANRVLTQLKIERILWKWDSLMSRINKKVEIEDAWMYTKNWAKLQKLDPQPSYPEVWNMDIQGFLQLIKEVNIIGGKSKKIYLLKFRYWRTSENCFLCQPRYSISFLLYTRKFNRRKINTVSVRRTSAKKPVGWVKIFFRLVLLLLWPHLVSSVCAWETKALDFAAVPSHKYFLWLPWRPH